MNYREAPPPGRRLGKLMAIAAGYWGWLVPPPVWQFRAKLAQPLTSSQCPQSLPRGKRLPHTIDKAYLVSEALTI